MPNYRKRILIFRDDDLGGNVLYGHTWPNKYGFKGFNGYVEVSERKGGAALEIRGNAVVWVGLWCRVHKGGGEMEWICKAW